MDDHIYMDYAATTALRKEVFAEMEPYFSKNYGNPSSLYGFASESRNAIEISRDQVSKVLKCRRSEIFFTSGGTESNNTIQCLSNVCTHRGHIINKKICNIKKMRCPYHGRMFDLNGTMDKMPGFEGVKNFPSQDDNLKNLPVLNWKDFIFTSINPQIEISDILNDISNRLNK